MGYLRHAQAISGPTILGHLARGRTAHVVTIPRFRQTCGDHTENMIDNTVDKLRLKLCQAQFKLKVELRFVLKSDEVEIEAELDKIQHKPL